MKQTGARHTQRCVLVVEDEPLIRMDTVSMLEDVGLSVVDFDRADEALEFALADGSDVAAIFTDINLRGSMDGIELASILADKRPDIVLLVTSGRYESRPRGLPDAVQFVKKPWLPLQVLTTMQDAVAA